MVDVVSLGGANQPPVCDLSSLIIFGRARQSDAGLMSHDLHFPVPSELVVQVPAAVIRVDPVEGKDRKAGWVRRKTDRRREGEIEKHEQADTPPGRQAASDSTQTGRQAGRQREGGCEKGERNQQST